MRWLALGSMVGSLGVLAAGCGGGGSKGVSNDQVKKDTLGQSQFGYFGQIKPHLSVSSGGVTVAGVSGASLSYIDFYPQPSLDETSIAYLRNEEVNLYNWATQTDSEITNDLVAGQASWSPNGQLVATKITGPGATELFTMYADGSHATAITGTGVATQRPSYSPDGTHIVGLDASFNLIAMKANGTSTVTLDTAAHVSTNCFPTWLNNTTVLYSRVVSGFDTLTTIPSSGGSPTTFVANIAGSHNDSPSVSPDGTLVAFANSATGADPWTINVASTSFGAPATLTTSQFSDTFPSFSPDGSFLTFRRTDNAGHGNDGIAGMYVETLDGLDPRALVIDPADGHSFSREMHWSPFYKYQRFIGSGGSFGSTSSGFLYAQKGPVIKSFFSFTATTPSSAVITPANSSGDGAPMVFSIAADAVTRLVFTNGYTLPATIISPSGATSVMISFDATDGTISTVAPLAATTKAARTLKPNATNGDVVYNAKFLAVYDGKGKNLAPTGASQVVIGSKGQLLSVR
ncbi:MAG TPA: hypothetical protein VG944_13415 [Fimbriimonas sp.]|nr:hypothetical protein [Fimbriimonas sp.]